MTINLGLGDAKKATLRLINETAWFVLMCVDHFRLIWHVNIAKAAV